MLDQRVKLAREACRLTQRELSERSGVSPSVIANIELGRTTVLPEESIVAIANVTGFPQAFFYLFEPPDMPDGYFRKKSNGRAKEERQVIAFVRLLVEFIRYAETVVTMPDTTYDIILERDKHVDLNVAENAAEQARDRLGIGRLDPIMNLTRAIERAGIIVARLPLISEQYESYSYWPDFGANTRPIIVVVPGMPGDRLRASLAHEIAHLSLHTLRRGTDPKTAETEAWLFAGALLLPYDALISDLEGNRPTLSFLSAIKGKYGVSMAFAARRLRDSEIISQDFYVSLMKQLSTRGWRKNEPGVVVSETPLLLPKITAALTGDTDVLMQRDLLSSISSTSLIQVPSWG